MGRPHIVYTYILDQDLSACPFIESISPLTKKAVRTVEDSLRHFIIGRRVFYYGVCSTVAFASG